MTAGAAVPIAVSDLLAALREGGELVDAVGAIPAAVRAVVDDSRHVAPGTLFLAVRGTARDGHDFLAAAQDRGATIALVEDAARTTLPRLVVRDGRRAAALIASAAFGHPARSLSLVGVTGTSGKTTTVSMLRHLLGTPLQPAASIGTLGVLVGSEGTPVPGGSGLTTPGPVEFQRVLRLLADAGVRRVAMEVSSHALEQRRVEGVAFDAAVFTNLSRDHLDYHGTMEAYLAAKARLVSHLSPGGVAVVNDDVDSWRTLPRAPRLVRYGLASAAAEVRAAGVAYGPSGSRWVLRLPDADAEVALPLMGDFNVANALAAAAAAWAMGVGGATVAERLSTLPQVPGRLERLLDHPTVLRDYAHKPDALERALRAVRPFTPGRLIVLFGCGGDRDRGKRPIMGGIAEREADIVILTSDNPRTEDPERILDEIEAGMQRRHERIEDRRAAIARALSIAAPGDVVVLAGKGHETYQLRGHESHPFDEKEIVQELAASSRSAAASP